jgi:hypothetical protein
MKWEQVTVLGDPPTGRTSHSSVVAGSKLVIFGGYANGLEKSDFFEIDLETTTGVHVTPTEKGTKIARVGHAALAIGKHVFVTGGWTGQQYSATGFLYDSEAQSIVLESSKERLLPLPRRDHSVVLLSDRIFLFGGWSSLEHFNDLWVLSESFTWTALQPEGDAPMPRRGQTMVGFNKSLIVFGGLYGFSKVTRFLYWFLRL